MKRALLLFVLAACGGGRTFPPPTRVARPQYVAPPLAPSHAPLASEPPDPAEAPTPAAPAVGDARLPGGARLLTVERHKGFPVVAVRAVIARGSVDAPPGVMALLAPALLTGIKQRTGTDLVQRFEALGARFATHYDFDAVSVTIETPRWALDEVLGLLVDILREPAFGDEQVTAIRERILFGHDLRRLAPNALAYDGLMGRLFPKGHPYHEPAWGSVASVGGLRAADVADAHRRLFAPDRTTFIVAGDFDPSALMARLTGLLAGWRGGELPAREVPPIAPRPRRIVIFDRREEPVVYIAAGWPVPDRSSSDRPALSFVASVLADRLERTLREERGDAYSIDANVRYYRGAGVLAIVGGVNAAHGAESVRAMLAEIERLRSAPLETRDAPAAYANSTVRLSLDLETGVQTVVLLEPAAIYGEPPARVFERRLARLPNAAREARRVAIAHLAPENAQIVLVGDAARLQKGLSELGEIEVVR